MDGFAHLHVASGYSLQYGASHPHRLVERAASLGQDTLALTDRDGTYGAVKFAKACLAAGVRPVLGVDLAHRPVLPPALHRPGPARPPVNGPVRGPVRGGAHRDERLPRATFLAVGRAGWAAVCRLVSATHLSGERGRPVLDLSSPAVREEVGPLLADGDVVVLLGPGSELGEVATRGRDDLAAVALAPWRDLVARDHLVVELVSHRLPAGPEGWGPGSTPHAARMLRTAHREGLPAVLTNAVRHAAREDAPVLDVLDAARRLVPIDLRHVDRRNAEGHLKDGAAMAAVADEVVAAAGEPGGRTAADLLARTRAVVDHCALDARTDLGLGEVHFPELALAGGGPPPRWTPGAAPADALLRARCEAAVGSRYGSAGLAVVWKRLDDELEVIRRLGYASYFLTVGDVTDLVRSMGVRCAARGSGAGSVVTYLLGISGVDPVRHGLLFERFLSPLRQALPDIDVDVESARRTEVYEAVLARYGGERCVCVSMMDTYRVRHAVRDVGAALGMPAGEVDAMAKAFPHVRARDARAALRDLPELRASGMGERRLDLVLDLVERLDGLPRHVAVHPCGVLLSDATLLDRTPVEASHAGFPMSQFDKDDVEDLGLLKLDVLGIRMQSAMAHAVAEVARTDGVAIDLDDEADVPRDDPATYALMSSARTLGVFQIESPGQRELVGKSGLESFEEVITDISLFRPGPVKSDMITPYLEAKQGWKQASYLHPDLRPVLEPTHGVVVFHEQVIEIIATLAQVPFDVADEKRRALGDAEGMAETKAWFYPRALARYDRVVVDRVWEVLAAFASFGFCKAHAAAFALPTFQSAWLKAHWPAHFLAGVLTHDPGMYPKRLILDDARQFGTTVLGLDVDRSGSTWSVERLPLREDLPAPGPGLPDARCWGLRLPLTEVKGISGAEVARIVAARPYSSLADLWHRARPSRPVAERLVLTGALDRVHGIRLDAEGDDVRRRAGVTRRDLLLQVAELDRTGRSLDRAARGRGLARRGTAARPGAAPRPADVRAAEAAARTSSDPREREAAREGARAGVRERAAGQSQATRPVDPVSSVQLALDLGDGPDESPSGLPEMGAEERMRAELEILGLDASTHVVAPYDGFLDALGVTRSRDLLGARSGAELLVAGVKVATQTPPIRSGRRVVFLTLDDATGPVDATFFEDVQGPYAATVFHSWLLVVRGVLRRTGPRGVSLRATGCWELPALAALGRAEGLDAVHARMAVVPGGFAEAGEAAVLGAAASRAPRPVMAPTGGLAGAPAGSREPGAAGGMGRRRVLVHSTGFRQSPYSDVKPAGDASRDVARKLWHRSPGSPG